MWWIYLASEDVEPTPISSVEGDEEVELWGKKIILPKRDNVFQPVGHIALDWIDYKGDKRLADRETGTM